MTPQRSIHPCSSLDGLQRTPGGSPAAATTYVKLDVIFVLVLIQTPDAYSGVPCRLPQCPHHTHGRVDPEAFITFQSSPLPAGKIGPLLQSMSHLAVAEAGVDGLQITQILRVVLYGPAGTG